MTSTGFRLERMNKPTYNVVFSKDNVSKDLNKVWKEEVESVFASHGLTCRLNKDECKMILETGNTEDEDIINRARRALCVLACGLSTQWELQRKWYCFVLFFDECITVLATSFQATSAVMSLVRESLFGTIPFQDNVEILIRCIENYDQEEKTLTNNLELFCSLLAGVSE